MTPSPHPAEAQERDLPPLPEAIAWRYFSDYPRCVYYTAGDPTADAEFLYTAKQMRAYARASHAPAAASGEAVDSKPRNGGMDSLVKAVHGSPAFSFEGACKAVNEASNSGEAVILEAEAIAEGCDSLADYVDSLKTSSNTYFAERNSARDAYRRHRDESEARGKLINIVLGLVDAPPGANVVQAVAAALAKANPAAGAEPSPVAAMTPTGIKFYSEKEMLAIKPGAQFYLAPPATSERDAEDAARYRHLRNAAIPEQGRVHCIVKEKGKGPAWAMGSALDDITDAQRKQSEKRSGEGGQ